MPAAKVPDRSIVVTHVFAAPRPRVFEALTAADQVPRWFAPQRMSLAVYEVDWQVGGSFRYVFRRATGAQLEVHGVYREVEAPVRWVYLETYSFSPIELLVTTQLDEAGGETVLTQTILYATEAERDDDFDAVAGSAADLYAKLDRYLQSES